jgi:opacity protein-like surface antigen
MKNVLLLSVVSALLFSMSASAYAQDILLKRRSGLELNIGIWAGGASTTVSPGGVTTEANIGAFAGGLLFSHWMKENLSVTISAGLLAAKASSSVSITSVEQQASSVTALLLGVRFYLPDPEPDAGVRPFLSGAIGTYIGSEAKSTLFSQGAYTETAFGGRLGGGIDFILSDHFKLGANAGYNLMSDFSTPVGGRNNYNGGDFSIGIGYMF